MITRKRKTFLLGLLGAATAAGMVLGATGVISSAVGEPLEVNAEDSVMTDRITADKLKATSSSYADFTYETSFATYSGNTAKNSTNIQMRGEKNSGIVITSLKDDSYVVSKISVSFASNTNTSRELSIYGSYSPFSSSSDLYSGATLIGQIPYQTEEATFDLSSISDEQYPYVGIRSKTGALYLSYVDFTYVKTKPEYDIVDLNLSGIYKTEYYDGETLNLNGLVVKGVDEIGDLQDVTYTTEPANGSILKTGDEVYVVYSDTLKKKIENITVSDRTLASIEVKKLPNKTSYILGEKLDVTGIVVNGIYDLGTPADVTEDCVFTPETFDTLGEQTITVTHTPTGKTTTFAVQVNSKRATSLSISNPTKMFMENDKFTFGSGTITVKWNDSSTNVVAMDDPDLRIELVDSIDARPGTGDPIDFDYVMKGSDTHRFVLVSYLDASNKYQIAVRSLVDYSAGSFYPIQSVDEISITDHILLVYTNSEGESFAMGSQNEKSYRNSVSVTVENGSITLEAGGEVQAIELLAGINDNSYVLHVGSQILSYSDGNSVDSIPDNSSISGSSSWTITMKDGLFEIKNVGDTGRYLQYNASNPRFACYKTSSNQSDVKIYKYIEDAEFVRDFVDTYMHMSDYNENKNMCYGPDGYYAKAKEALVKLTDKQIELFKTDSEFNDAHLRYLAWAAANGDNSPYSGEYVSPALSIRNSDDLMDIAVISALAVAGIAAAGAFVFLRRKKEA